MDKLPFSVYDFFAYLASGFTLLVGLAAAIVGTDDWQKTPTFIVALVLVVLAYSVGHIVANVSSYLFERRLVGKLLKTPTVNLFKPEPEGWRARLLQGYFHPLPPEQQKRVLEKAKRAAEISGPTEALFLHCFGTVKEREPVIVRLNTFQNLYGFCRNMALSLLIVGAALAIGSGKGSAHTGNLVPPGWWAAGCLVGGIVLLYRYLKFFRHHRVEVFISYAESSRAVDTREPPAQPVSVGRVPGGEEH